MAPGKPGFLEWFQGAVGGQPPPRSFPLPGCSPLLLLSPAPPLPCLPSLPSLALQFSLRGGPRTRSPQGLPGNRLLPPWSPFPFLASQEFCPRPAGQLLEEGTGPALGEQPREPAHCPRLGTHNQLAQTPHTQAPAVLRAAQPIVQGRASRSRNSYYGMEISQVQTTRPGCERRCLPSVLFWSPQAALPSRCSPHLPRPSARGCPKTCRDPGVEVRAGESDLAGLCVCVRIYVCVHLCVHVCICVYVCCTHTPVCTHVLYTFTSVHTCVVHVYICVRVSYTCTPVHACGRGWCAVCICVYVHEYTCVHWYTHVYPCLCSHVWGCVRVGRCVHVLLLGVPGARPPLPGCLWVMDELWCFPGSIPAF